MAFCPACRFEYVSGTTTCPDCGLELVAELPQGSRNAPAGPAEEDVLCTVQGEIHAKLLCDALRSQGIAARVASGWPFDGPSEALRPPPPIGSAANACFRVYVRADDLRRALTVYGDLELMPPEECGTADDS
jgi:hypothetical protein